MAYSSKKLSPRMIISQIIYKIQTIKGSKDLEMEILNLNNDET
jgi:hypothetical protein